MAMLEPLPKTASRQTALERSILYLVASLVSHSAKPVNGKDKRMTGISGLRCFASWENSGQGEYWAKMSQGYSQSLIFPTDQGEHLEPYSMTWPRWGIVLDMRATELVMLVRRIKGTEFSSWAPTPHGNCGNGAGSHGTGGDNLQTVVQMWRTPQAHNGNQGPKSKEFYDRCLDTNESSITLTDQARHTSGNAGQLNADWVEILMNFPIGWTDIDCEEPEEWPGPPAPLGVGQMWGTHTASGTVRSQEYIREGISPAEFVAMNMESGQYEYEPPRVIQGQKNRAKRLKCLGNAVYPSQVYPIFAAIVAVEDL